MRGREPLPKGGYIAQADNTALAQGLEPYQAEITPEKRGVRMEQSHLTIISEGPVSRRTTTAFVGKELTTQGPAPQEDIPLDIQGLLSTTRLSVGSGNWPRRIVR